MPDIRTAAQREAEHRWPSGEQWSAKEVESARGRFMMGAVWAAARVTAKRAQIAERMKRHHFEECVFDGGKFSNGWFAKCSCGWESPEFVYPQDAHDAYYVHASERVAALMQELAEGES